MLLERFLTAAEGTQDPGSAFNFALRPLINDTVTVIAMMATRASSDHDLLSA